MNSEFDITYLPGDADGNEEGSAAVEQGETAVEPQPNPEGTPAAVTGSLDGEASAEDLPERRSPGGTDVRGDTQGDGGVQQTQKPSPQNPVALQVGDAFAVNGCIYVVRKFSGHRRDPVLRRIR